MTEPVEPASADEDRGGSERTVPTAALLVVPRAGHTINSEEPAAMNAALADLFSAAEAGRWLAHKPA